MLTTLKKKDINQTPSPGSHKAIKQGCKCPEIDNHYGKGYDGAGKNFWCDEKCPLHGFVVKEALEWAEYKKQKTQRAFPEMKEV